jgi:hypothetical protein
VGDSSYLYVADTSNHRVSRYLKNGTYMGWIGRVLTTPAAGSAGCSTTTPGNVTPGYCYGGTSQSGQGDGMMNNPYQLAIDATYLYIAEGSGRVSRYFKTTGTFDGWIGYIAVQPTGGAAGCSSAPIYSNTPGWCTGGEAGWGWIDGGFAPANAVYLQGGFLYVSTGSNGRIVKMNATTGAFVGWKGNVIAQPTGGDAGCTSVSLFTAAPGWCTGGEGDIGLASGMYRSPVGISGDGTYLYIADQDNNRVMRITP